MEYACSKERFDNEVSSHEMTVFKDDDLYRHIRFKKPNTMSYYFDIITWPGNLTICGDMGTFTFARVRDMFDFFKGDQINPSYWHEKMIACDSHSKSMEFSSKIFEEMIEYRFKNLEFESDELKDAAWDDVQDKILSHYPQSIYEVVQLTDDYSIYLNEKEYCPFTEMYMDGNFEDYTFHFIWICYAIQWGVNKYNESK